MFEEKKNLSLNLELSARKVYRYSARKTEISRLDSELKARQKHDALGYGFRARHPWIPPGVRVTHQSCDIGPTNSGK